MSIIKEEEDQTFREDPSSGKESPFQKKPKVVSTFGAFMNNNEVKAEDIGNIVPMRDLVVEQKNFAKKDQLDDKKKGKKKKKRKNKSGVNKTFDDKDLQI